MDCMKGVLPYSRFLFSPVVCFSSLLLSKPEAAHKALSDNSLLKNIEFNEKFLGEENITEGRSISKIFHFIFKAAQKQAKDNFVSKQTFTISHSVRLAPAAQ